MRLKWAYAVLAATPITLLAFRNGSPVKRTGTIDGGLDCSECHSTLRPPTPILAGASGLKTSILMFPELYRISGW